MLDDDEIDEAISRIQRHYRDRLTEWEEEFIENIAQLRLAGRELSDGRRKKLEEIFDKCARS